MDFIRRILSVHISVTLLLLCMCFYKVSYSLVICSLSFNSKTSVRCQPTVKFNQFDSSSFKDVFSNKIIKLNASNCGIYKIDPKAFIARTTITHIDFSNNYLLDLNGIAALNGLIELDLSDNVFIGQTPARMITNHPKITKLVLRNNPVNEYNLKMLYWSISLMTFDISSNDVTDIHPVFFERNVRMQELNISNNRIAKLHPETFHSLINLKVLDLCDNKLSTLPSRLFLKNIALERLDITGNLLHTIEASTFYSTPRLNYLRLSRNQLSISIWYVIQTLTELKELHLENNFIEEVLTSTAQFPNLKRLSLACNNLAVLPIDFFEIYSMLDRVSLYGNPWKCSCLLETLYTMENRTIDLIVNDRNINGMFPACIIVEEERVCQNTKVHSDMFMGWLENGGSVPCNSAKESEQFIDIK